MKISIENLSLETSNEIPLAWNLNDYNSILSQFSVGDLGELSIKEAEEMTLMAIADEEPTQSAIELLTYKLGELLNEGQIEQIANDMQADKIYEEYPVISMHHHLFAINQLLRKAYNGKFPSGEIVIIRFGLKDIDNALENIDSVTNEIILRALSTAMPERSIVKRLFPDELSGEKPFTDADAIIWRKEIVKSGDVYKIEIISSDYWLGDLLMGSEEFTTEVTVSEESEEE